MLTTLCGFPFQNLCARSSWSVTMATLHGDEELWKVLNSSIWAYKTHLAQPDLDYSDNDDDIPEVDIEASDEETHLEGSPIKRTATDCSECKTKFNTTEELAEHEKVHLGESNYICEECGEGFGMKKTLNSHLTVHKVEKKFECDTCQKKFDYRDNLLFHMRIHARKQTFNCEVCNQKFASKELRDNHSMKHVVSVQDKNNPNRVLLLPIGKRKPGEGSAAAHPVAEVFTCDMCNKKYADKVSLENHKVVHIRHERGPKMLVRKKGKQDPVEKLHFCPKCNECFKERALFMVHLANCKQMKFHKCHKCGGRFHHKVTYKNHVVRCDGSIMNAVQSVPCAFCKKFYHVPPESKPDGSHPMKFICEPCCTQMAQKSQFSGFIPRLENRFICNKCERCFASEESLREHFKSHVADCYYTCPKCDEKKYFMTKRALQEHLASHRASQKECLTYPRSSDNSVESLHSPSKSGYGPQSAGSSEKNSPVMATKKLNGKVTLFTSKEPPTRNHARSQDNKLYSSSRPDKRRRLIGNTAENGEVVRVKSEPSVKVDESATGGTCSNGGGGSRSHLYYSEDTSDAGMLGMFSLVRGNSSDEESNDEDLDELDVFVKKEFDDDNEDENDLNDTLGSCTVFNPVRPKDSLGVSFNIPDKVIKQEDTSCVATKWNGKPDVIKQDPDGSDTILIKQEQLDEGEELTIKDEMDYFNRHIKDEKSDYQENFEFTLVGNTHVKEEVDS